MEFRGKPRQIKGRTVIEDADGSKEWYVDGKCLTQAQWLEAVKPKVVSCVGKIVEVDGVKYKLVAA